MHGVPVTLVLEPDREHRLLVGWLASASVTKQRNDDLNCRIEAVAPYRLKRSVEWDALVASLPRGVARRIVADGTLPKGAGRDLLGALQRLAPETTPEIARILNLRPTMSVSSALHSRKAFQRDATITALKMAGFDPTEHMSKLVINSWDEDSPWAGPDTRVTEDAQIIADLHQFRDWLGLPTSTGAVTFTEPGGRQRLDVFYANRTRAETSTGADLIYHHHTRQSFVLVQYKKLAERGLNDWYHYVDGDLLDELDRLRAIDKRSDGEASPDDDFRLAQRPGWFKFCQGRNVLPQDAGLVGAMYLPAAYLDQLINTGALAGPRNGTVVSYRTIPRYLETTQFTALVADGWIGTSGKATSLVHEQITESLQRGRDLVVAHSTGEPLNHADRVSAKRGGPGRRVATRSAGR